MAMKWREIFKYTPRDRRTLAEFVKVLRVKKGRDKNGFAVAMAETTSLMSPDGEIIKPNKRVKYLTTVTFIDSDLHVRVSCSCPDQMYRWEVPLNKRGAAAIEYSNGQPTRITNPSSVPGMCKHLVAFYRKLKSEHSQL